MIIPATLVYLVVAAYFVRIFRKGYESWASSLFFGLFWLPLLWLMGVVSIYEKLTD